MISERILSDLRNQARHRVQMMSADRRDQLAEQAVLMYLVRERTLSGGQYRRRVSNLIIDAAPSFGIQLTQLIKYIRHISPRIGGH